MLRQLTNYQSLVPLLLRLGVGLTFFLSGLGKVMGGVDGVAGFFGSIGIPAASLMAPLISYLELIGGLALIVGALTRVFSLLFIATMLVAIFTAKWGAFVGAESLPQGFGEIRVEILLLLGSLCLALLGGGAFSVDRAFLGDREEVAEPRRLTA